LGGHESAVGRLEFTYALPVAAAPSHVGKEYETGAEVTEVRSSRGGITRFHIAVKGGRHVVLGVEGDPCPGCPPVSGAYTYNDSGNVIGTEGRSSHLAAKHAMDRKTRPSAAPAFAEPAQIIQRDHLGRMTQVAENNQHINLSWLKETHLLTRLEQPSVLGGYRRLIEIDWDDATGAPKRIREQGWRPRLKADGSRGEEADAVSRTIFIN